ncbi:MAG TPA: hypothetical protein VF839_05505 [Clostridium sp.]
MANMVLTLGSVNKDDGIVISLTGRTLSTDLTDTEVKVLKLNGTSFAAATYYLSTTGPSSATIKGGSQASPASFLVDDLLLIQVIESGGSQVSNRVSVDLAEPLSGKQTYKYYSQMPSQAGEYKMDLLTVNDETAGDLSDPFTLIDPKLATILVPVYKTYLTPVIGQVATVDVDFGASVTGTYQVVFSADQQ